MKKNRAAALAAAAVFISGMTAVPVSAEENSEDTVILFTNDIHCGADVNIGFDGLALYKREMQAQHENVFLVDAGDAIQGMPLGTLSNGEYITRLMNAVGYDVAIPGNHEFDFGFEELHKRESELECGYICCNLFSTETGENVFTKYTILDTSDGKKIGFVGVTTPESFHSSTPVFFQNESGEYIYDFSGDNLYETVQENIDAVRNDGADYVIVVGHLGENGCIDGWTAPDVAANTTGADVFIDGHSHEETPSLEVENKDGKKVIIAQTGTKFANIGKLTITPDGKFSTELISEVPAPDGSLGFAEDTWTEADDREGRYVDADTNLLIHEIEAEADEKLSVKIGETPFKLWDSDPETGARRVRTGETNIGDLCADAYRAYLGTDIALINGGGIRASIEAGDITYRDAITVQPFNNMVCAAEVSGQQILDLLEVGAQSYPEENGSFANVSGMTYSIDPSIESSVQVNEYNEFVGVTGEYRVKDVYINGEPLDPDKTYTIASHDYFLKNGGDGYIMSGKCNVYLDSVISDSDLIAAYIRDDLGGVIPEEYSDPYGQGRITILDASSAEPSEDEAVEEEPAEEEAPAEDAAEEPAPSEEAAPAEEPASDSSTTAADTGNHSTTSIAVVSLAALAAAAAASRKRK